MSDAMSVGFTTTGDNRATPKALRQQDAVPPAPWVPQARAGGPQPPPTQGAPGASGGVLRHWHTRLFPGASAFSMQKNR